MTMSDDDDLGRCSLCEPSMTAMMCGVHDKQGFACTRECGHSGYHAACGGQGEHPIVQWEQPVRLAVAL